jgi:hypothetical protein
MAVPHFFFWPFDRGRSETDRERARAKTHIADDLRLGVLAQEEGAELRMEGHVMACEVCREASISLLERMREKVDPVALAQGYSCAQTRNALFRHLEEGRPLDAAVISHLRDCIGCGDHFLESAKALHTMEVDEEAIAAQD